MLVRLEPLPYTGSAALSQALCFLLQKRTCPPALIGGSELKAGLWEPAHHPPEKEMLHSPKFIFVF